MVFVSAKHGEKLMRRLHSCVRESTGLRGEVVFHHEPVGCLETVDRLLLTKIIEFFFVCPFLQKVGHRVHGLFTDIARKLEFAIFQPSGPLQAHDFARLIHRCVGRQLIRPLTLSLSLSPIVSS